MARAPTICPHCANPQPCPEHGKVAWAGSTRRSRLPKGWSSRTVPRILRRDPICKACGNALSREVDHIVNNDDHSDTNLQGICTRCHRTKSAAEGQAAR